MTHDPLCPKWPVLNAGPLRGPAEVSHPEASQCAVCDLIARVREDERRNNFTPDDHADAMTQARAAALRDAVEAVKALEPRLDVEKGMGGYDCCGCSTPDALFCDAVAAIEALGGER